MSGTLLLRARQTRGRHQLSNVIKTAKHRYRQTEQQTDRQAGRQTGDCSRCCGDGIMHRKTPRTAALPTEPMQCMLTSDHQSTDAIATDVLPTDRLERDVMRTTLFPFSKRHGAPRCGVVTTLVSEFRCPAPDLWLAGDYFVGQLFIVGQPTRPTQPSIPPGSVNKVVLDVITRITGWRPLDRRPGLRTASGQSP